MLNEKEIALMGLCERAGDSVSTAMALGENLPAAIIALLHDLDGARYAAAQHLQTVETQAKIIAGYAAPSAQQAAGSIDTPEFREIVSEALIPTGASMSSEGLQAIIAHINAWAAATLAPELTELGFDLCAPPSKSGLITRLKEMSQIIRAGCHFDGNGHVFTGKSATDVCMLDDILSDAFTHANALNEKLDHAEAAIYAGVADRAKPALAQGDYAPDESTDGAVAVVNTYRDASGENPQLFADMLKTVPEGTRLFAASTDDMIAKSKRILALVDIYHETPGNVTRTALRVALMDEFGTPTKGAATPAQPIAPFEAIEHGTLKRAAFADDLFYSMYLAERRDAQPIADVSDLTRTYQSGYQAGIEMGKAMAADVSAPTDVESAICSAYPVAPNSIGEVEDRAIEQRGFRKGFLAARAAAPIDQSPYEAITLANLRAGKLSAARVYVGYCELSEELKAANGAIKRYEAQARAAAPVSGPTDA